MYQNTSDTVKYVDTAAASHGSALLTCGQTSISDGYGNSQYANHGRPRCSAGKIAACSTANSVIASDSRLIDVRQPCSNRYRIAEMNVPAWPIPIHHTKLMIANAYATGMLTPHTPMPVATVYVINAI